VPQCGCAGLLHHRVCRAGVEAALGRRPRREGGRAGAGAGAGEEAAPGREVGDWKLPQGIAGS
jgi:hypothetical protein